MSFLFYHISTWLIIELTATSTLVALNMVIPCLMAFTSYRNMVNFYFSSAALSSSLLNCLYIYYLVQTLRSRGLSENNCRAIYYLQTSCTVVLAYTITAMHANFVLYLLSPSTSSSSSDRHNSSRTCLQSCGLCLRRFFRRFCFCMVLCVWSLSFTATIPLLYTIDSNEKAPRPVYCPGTTQISYMEELFDRNRLAQSVIFNIIPLLVTLFISMIALLKLLCDCLSYFYLRLKMSKCSPYRKRLFQQQQQQQNLTLPNSISMLSSLGILSNSNIQSGLNVSPMTESPTPTSEITISSSNLTIQSCGSWCSSSFLRFLLVLSCCLLACIYPIAMRFYLVYFSVLVPLIFAVLNYSLGQATPTQTSTTNEITITRASIGQQTSIEDGNMNLFDERNNGRRNSLLKREQICSNEQYELQSPLMSNLIEENDEIDENEQSPVSPSISSQSSTLPTSHSHSQYQRSPNKGKRKYFSNNLYDYNRNVFMR